MRFIDKSILEKEAEDIVCYFLKELKKEGIAYPMDLYKAFGSAKDTNKNFLKELLTNLLFKEQQNYCCYCMCKLEKGEETIEHIIPNKVKNKAEFEKYLRPNTVLNSKKVCFAKEFIENKGRTFPPYPHTIAYQNLAVSCNGKFSKSESTTHCNLERGDKYIEPFILDNLLVEKIEYKPDGSVILENGDAFIKILGLNENRLKMIRRIWLYANKFDCKIMDYDNTQKTEFIYKLLAEIPDDEIEMLFNFNKESYWKIVVNKYNYFASYKK